MTPEAFAAWDGIEPLPGMLDMDVIFEVRDRVSVAAFRFKTGTGYEVLYAFDIPADDMSAAILTLTGERVAPATTVRDCAFPWATAQRSVYWAPAV